MATVIGSVDLSRTFAGGLMIGYWLVKEPIVLAIDRTSWRKYNLLVVSWIAD